MSYAMRIIPLSKFDEWSTSSYWLHLLAMLLSSRSSLSCWSLVGRWQPSYLSLFRSLCWPSRQAHHSFIWFTCCSNSWVPWVSWLTATVKVYTYLSKALEVFLVF